MTIALDPRATALARARYDRTARFYDSIMLMGERQLAPWRAQLWTRVDGPRVLEIGARTGANIPYYPDGLSVTAMDLSPRMLELARIKAAELNRVVDLREADAQALPFPDASFDTVLATCVF
ncbi:MAG: class I SAM-dependent methyltransferase, partial [Chloroflexi bacterium]|nr:class I SAM-dependent methyltransferase [Chloroflexota bacterium]